MASQYRQMTPLEARTAFYIDFEGGKDAPPVLIGILRKHTQQYVVEPAFADLGPAYLELIGPDPAQAAPADGLPFGLHLPGTRARLADGPRLLTWVARCDGIEALAALSPVPLGAPRAMSRGDLTWLLTIPEDGVPPCGGIVPGLIEGPGGGSPPAEAMADGPLRLRSLRRRADPEAEAALAALGLADAAPEGPTGDGPLRAVLDTPNGPVVLD